MSVDPLAVLRLQLFAYASHVQESPGKGRLIQVVEFIYTIAHGIGVGIVNVIQWVVPPAKIARELVDPIGVLAIVTIFVAVASVSRRATWIVLGVAWLLIVVRTVMALLK
ncbi:MAG: hypothetical protein ACE5JN_01400 [Candidatus Methylomirabilia bacterium]